MPSSFTSLPYLRGRPSPLVAAVVAPVLGLGLVPGAARAEAASGAGIDPPRFVQQGTPADVGGTLIPWGETEARHDSAATPNPAASGATDVAVATNAQSWSGVVLRSDGTVASIGTDSSVPRLPDVPEGVDVTAITVSTNGSYFLLSDGTISATSSDSGEPSMPPALPDGVRYVAIDAGDGKAFYAVRSDGQLVGFGSERFPERLGCRDKWTPANGAHYVAVSARGYGWIALRDDGVAVACGLGQTGAEVFVPDQGLKYVGVEAGSGHGLAARSDGRVVGSRNMPVVQPPPGRTVTALSTDAGGRVALLDNGTLHNLAPEPIAAPRIPADRQRYSTLLVGSSEHWAIMQGAPIETQIAVDMPVTTWAYREPIQAEVSVSGPGGYVPEGRVSLTFYEKTSNGLVPAGGGRGLLVDGSVVIEPRSYQISPGSYLVRAQFDGLPSASVTWEGTATVNPPTPTAVAFEGPTTWQVGAAPRLKFDVDAIDGTPIGGSGFTIDIESDNGHNWRISGGLSWDGVSEHTLDYLPAGSYDVTFRYIGWAEDRGLDPVDSSEWSGTFQVSPATVLENLTPATWPYGQPHYIEASLYRETAPISGEVAVLLDGKQVATIDVADGHGRVALAGTEVLPGSHRLALDYGGSPEAGPASWADDITVLRGVLAVSALPSISGTPQVGMTLRAHRGTWVPEPDLDYQWRVDGQAVAGATRSTWKIPASAKGKRISVAATGSETGYETKTVVSLATAAVKAGVFVAPTPTISGTARVGSTLQVYRGTWTPQPSTVTHQWKIDGRSVAGATRSTFRVPTSARGKRVSVVVTGSLAGYTTKSVSKSTGLIR